MIMLRIRRKLPDGKFDRPRWRCPIQFGTKLETLERAESAMLRFNGRCEVWGMFKLADGTISSTLLSSNVLQ